MGMIARKGRQGNQRPEMVLQQRAGTSSFTIVAYLSPGETLTILPLYRVVTAYICRKPDILYSYYLGFSNPITLMLERP